MEVEYMGINLVICWGIPAENIDAELSWSASPSCSTISLINMPRNTYGKCRRSNVKTRLRCVGLPYPHITLLKGVLQLLHALRVISPADGAGAEGLTLSVLSPTAPLTAPGWLTLQELHCLSGGRSHITGWSCYYRLQMITMNANRTVRKQ